MLSSSVCYPYPVLRKEPFDFVATVFSSEFDVMRENDGFRLVPNFSVNNSEIEELIASGKLSYAVQIECTSTWYRDMIYIKNNESIILPTSKLHYRVDILPCIIATEDIQEYSCSDFVDLYKELSFSLKKNDVVGVGGRKKFDAIYKSDILKKPSSIVQTKVDKNIDSMRVSLDDKYFIYAYLPEDQWEIYNKGEMWTDNQKQLALAVICTPALVYALTVMSQVEDEDDNEYEDSAWYKSLLASVTALANGDPDKVKILLEDPVNTVQLLLRNNSLYSLKIIETMG